MIQTERFDNDHPQSAEAKGMAYLAAALFQLLDSSKQRLIVGLAATLNLFQDLIRVIPQPFSNSPQSLLFSSPLLARPSKLRLR